MFPFLDKELVIFDLEYTDPHINAQTGEIPEITEVAGIKVNSSLEIIETFSILVRPNNLSLQTSYMETLTGITKEMLESEKTWKEIMEDWCYFTNFNRTRLVSWHAYNDYRVLRVAYTRAMWGYPHQHFIVDAAALCYGIFSYIGMKPKNWQLKSVCNRLHIPFEEKHRAGNDANAVLQILRQIQSFEETFLGGKAHGVGDSSLCEGTKL